MLMVEQKWFFVLNSINPIGAFLKKVVPNDLGIFQEYIYESSILKKSYSSLNWIFK